MFHVERQRAAVRFRSRSRSVYFHCTGAEPGTATYVASSAHRGVRMPDELPEVVRLLVNEKLDSVPQLEAVLLLRGYRECAWTPEQVAERLYVSTATARHVLRQLKTGGFFAVHGETYWYAPESTDLAKAISELARVYPRHLVEITQLIHSKARSAP